MIINFFFLQKSKNKQQQTKQQNNKTTKQQNNKTMNIPEFKLDYGLFVKQTDSCYQCPDLLQNLVDLGYMRYDEDAKMVLPTTSGLKYLETHHDTVKYLIQKYNVDLPQFGPMGWAFSHFYNTEDRISDFSDDRLVDPNSNDKLEYSNGLSQVPDYNKVILNPNNKPKDTMMGWIYNILIL